MGIGSAFRKVLKPVEKMFGGPIDHILPGDPVRDSLDKLYGAADEVWDSISGADAIREQAQLQNEYNLKYWQMQNEYNTPAAQMKRFIDAGLNPNLAYSLSNTAGDVGRVNVGVRDNALGVASKVISAISAWQGIKNMRLQNENLAYQTEFTKLQNRQMLQNIRRTKFENDWMERTGTPSFGGPIDKLFGAIIGHSRDALDWLYNNVEKINFDSTRKN